MAGYSDLLVGYRESDEYRNVTLMRYAGRCISCGARVHVVPSGFEILQRDDCDARLVCNICDRLYPDEYERVMG
jgi:hypothetical protein